MSAQADDIISEIRALNAELDQIQDRASEITAKVDETLQEAGRVAGKVAETGVRIAGQLAKSDRELGVKVGVGALVLAGAGALVAQGYGAIKKAHIQKKVDKELAVLLAKKQEIARVKLKFIEKAMPRAHRLEERMDRLLCKDVEQILPEDRWDRYPKVQPQLSKLFDNKVEAVFTRQRLEYYDSEFNAWLDGRHTSGLDRPKRKMIRRALASEAEQQVAALLPDDPSSSSLMASMPAGFELALHLRQEFPSSTPISPRLQAAITFLASSYARSRLIPFGHERRQFRHFFETTLETASLVQVKAQSYFRLYVAAAICVVLTMAAGGYGINRAFSSVEATTAEAPPVENTAVVGEAAGGDAP